MLSYLLNFDSTSKHTNAKIAHVYAKHLFKSSGIIRKAENNINKINLWETYYVPVSEYLCKINVTAVQRLYRFSIHKTSWKLKFPFTPFFVQIFLFKLITWSYLEKLKLKLKHFTLFNCVSFAATVHVLKMCFYLFLLTKNHVVMPNVIRIFVWMGFFHQMPCVNIWKYTNDNRSVCNFFRFIQFFS